MFYIPRGLVMMCCRVQLPLCMYCRSKYRRFGVFSPSSVPLFPTCRVVLLKLVVPVFVTNQPTTCSTVLLEKLFSWSRNYSYFIEHECSFPSSQKNPVHILSHIKTLNTQQSYFALELPSHLHLRLSSRFPHQNPVSTFPSHECHMSRQSCLTSFDHPTGI